MELVLVKDGKSLLETVRARELPFGAPLRLAEVEVEDLVMIQLSDGAGYIPIEGAALRERLAGAGGAGVRPFKVRAIVCGPNCFGASTSQFTTINNRV